MFNQECLLLVSNSLIDELDSLESVIKLTQESCLDKEIDSIYYNLNAEDKLILSKERNHYINLLTIALQKVKNLKENSLDIERRIVSL